MTSQRTAPFRGGQRLVFARWLGELFGQAQAASWRDEPCCLVRRGSDAAELVRESTAREPFGRLQAGRPGSRLLAMAAPRAGDGLVIVHEHRQGARMVTRRGSEDMSEWTWPEEHMDLPLATDGQRIVVCGRRRTAVWSHDDWSLGPPRPWSLEPVRGAVGEARLHVWGLHALADSLLIATTHAWSRWRWDGEMIDCWRAPSTEWSPPHLVAWHAAGPVLYTTVIDPATGRRGVGRDAYHLVVWDLERGEGLSLGTAHDWPRATRSPDGRWLVADRVTKTGRGLELWDLSSGALVERLGTRRRAVQAIAFAPDSTHVAVATMDDFFVMRVVT